MKSLILFLCFLINSCATVVSPSQNIPSYLSQDSNLFYINLIFDQIPNYSFIIDDELVSPEIIMYQKLKNSHLIKVPVKEGQKDFKVKSALKTYLHKRIHLKENPNKIMMFASTSRPILKAIKRESPDLIITFAPPETQYYSENDFLKNDIFFQDELRLLYVVGHKLFKQELTTTNYLITGLENVSSIDRPSFLTHYLPFSHPGNDQEFLEISQKLRMKEIPVVFLSSFPQNLIQQIPKGQMGLPAYEFSVKNHFLALAQNQSSPWEMITDHRCDYLTLEIEFIDSYWHILLKGKDETQELVFDRDLTLYQTKPYDGRTRRRAR